MTSIAEDWETLPPTLRTWTAHAIATRREWREDARPLSKQRAQQLARARYTTLMSIMHAVDPRMNQPLHQSLHRLAFFGGDSYVFRNFLARLNVLTSEEGARLTRIYESDESTAARKLYVQKRLDEGYYFMLAVDNLDWATMRSAVHLYQRSKGDQGRHILNRMAFALKTTPTIRALPDEWTAYKDVTLEDVIEPTAEEKQSFAGFVKRFADVAKEYTGDKMDRDILSFRKLINKRPLDGVEAASLSTDEYRHPSERTRDYQGERRDASGEVTQRRGFTPQPHAAEEEEMPRRLLRNVGVVGKRVTLDAALPAGKVHDWSTPALDAGTTLQAVMALDKGLSVHVDGDTRSCVVVPDLAFFGECAGDGEGLRVHQAPNLVRHGHDAEGGLGRSDAAAGYGRHRLRAAARQAERLGAVSRPDPRAVPEDQREGHGVGDVLEGEAGPGARGLAQARRARMAPQPEPAQGAARGRR